MPDKFKLEIKDIITIGTIILSISAGYWAFDKRLALYEQKLDGIAKIVESVQRLAMDHEKRLIILEQIIR